MSPQVCICLMCGLPGCGKSTLAQQLSKDVHASPVEGAFFCTGLTQDVTLIHIEYDALLPVIPLQQGGTVLSNTATDNQDNTTGLWKQERAQVLRLIEVFIGYLSDTRGLSLSQMKPSEDISEDLWQKFLQIVMPSVRDIFQIKVIILLIDDNLYLHSMRYEYYKLARKYCCGFCQIFFNCPTHVAITRNRMRSNECRVPEEVISKMAERLEPPNADKFYWESNTHCVNTDGMIDIKTITELFKTALQSPVQPVAKTDDEEILKSQRECSSSTLHQVDLILRQCISSFMSSGKGSWPSTSMRQISKNVSQVKEAILKEFKDGAHNDALTIHQFSIEDSAKNPGSNFYEFVKELFSSKIKV